MAIKVADSFYGAPAVEKFLSQEVELPDGTKPTRRAFLQSFLDDSRDESKLLYQLKLFMDSQFPEEELRVKSRSDNRSADLKPLSNAPKEDRRPAVKKRYTPLNNLSDAFGRVKSALDSSPEAMQVNKEDISKIKAALSNPMTAGIEPPTGGIAELITSMLAKDKAGTATDAEGREIVLTGVEREQLELYRKNLEAFATAFSLGVTAAVPTPGNRVNTTATGTSGVGTAS